MLLSEAKGFAFVHVPKTGGVSLSNPLAWFCDVTAPRFYRGPIRREQMNQIQLRTYERHLTGLEIAAAVGAERWSRMESFGVVRDPLERIMSYFGYVRRLKDHAAHASMKDLDTPEAFVAEIGGRVKLRPQVHYLAGVKHVFPFERLEACYTDMVAQLEAYGEAPAWPPRLNGSKHPSWDEIFGGEVPAHVERFIDEDLKLRERVFRGNTGDEARRR